VRHSSPPTEFAPVRLLAERRRAAAGVPRRNAPRDRRTRRSVASGQRHRRRASWRSGHRRSSGRGKARAWAPSRARRQNRPRIGAEATQDLRRATTTRARSGSWASAAGPLGRARARDGPAPQAAVEAAAARRFKFANGADCRMPRARFARDRNGHRDASFALRAGAAVMAARCSRIELRQGTFESFEPSNHFHRCVTGTLFDWRGAYASEPESPPG